MAPTEIPTQTVDADGIRIAYKSAGEGNPVVFVHGNFASKRWFRLQLENPVDGYRYLALDLPNFGESAPLGAEATLQNYAEALDAFTTELGLDRFALVGHSLGAGVAQTYALAHPDRVAGMFLVSSPPPSGFSVPAGTEDAQRALRASTEQMGAALAATMPTSRPEDFGEIVSDGMALDPDVYGPHNRTLAAMDLTEAARAFDAPVWILRGAQDYLITGAMARELDDTYPNTRLELWDHVGHSPQIEDPERFRDLLATFLEGVAMP